MIATEKHILSIPTGKCYSFVVNRYRLVDTVSLDSRSSPSSSVILVLAHGLGFHKETWEPFLEDLKRLQENDAKLRENGLVTEAWSIDCPSHGDSAILNEPKLLHDDDFHSSQEYGRSIMALVESPVFAQARSGRVVLVGHSGGTCGVAVAMRECVNRWGARNTPFHSFVIIESPVLATPTCPLQERSASCKVIGDMMYEFGSKRRDKWGSVREAYDWLGKRLPYNDWDPRALRRFTDYGLRPLPTAFYPNEHAGVTLKAYRSFEADPAKGEETTIAGGVLEELHPLLPVHLIFAQLSPFRPPDGIHLLSSRTGKNTFYVSVTDIPDVNHLLVQEVPEIAARAVLGTLKVPRASPCQDSKL